MKYTSVSEIPWLKDPNVQPYLFVRPESHVSHPGSLHHLDWFPHQPIYKNPMSMDEIRFADRILHLEAKAFGPKNLEMPRWVFYDCAIIPGFIAGFAQRTESLPPEVKRIFMGKAEDEWTPLSLFIIIPTMAPGEWVAHNLCSVNSLLSPEQQYYGLGFLSKAFGLWYANVEICCGITQWMSPAVHLHCHYGRFEIITAYTPAHSFAHTITYRVKTDINAWRRFFSREEDPQFHAEFKPAGFEVDPTDEASIISLQRKIEAGSGPYFLDAREVKSKKLDETLTVYCPR